MNVKALAKNYFQVDDCPVSLCLVNQKNHITHDYDLTELEHYHDFMEIVFILKGQGIQVVEDNECQVAAGDIFVLLLRHYSQIDTTEARSLVSIGKVMKYFGNNPYSKINIDEMAKMANMSKQNFHRIFKNALGISPVIYLIQVRLQKARKLLRETDLQIVDISAITGFTDSNYFIKCFRQSYMTTPHKFKMGFRMSKKMKES